jgi:signal transduction histidine kinase
LRDGRKVIFREDAANLDLRCLVDPFPIEQVFRNILENALVACGDLPRIDIVCRAEQLNGIPVIGLRFRDNGRGLNAEERRRIFEPFFTTKTHGTGLGMAIARRIVEAHGGHIAVSASAGPGTEIEILLPKGVSS